MKKKRIRAPGWLVWGRKKGRKKNRQLGVGKRLKKEADKIASRFRKKGYVAYVQPMVRKPRDKD